MKQIVKVQPVENFQLFFIYVFFILFPSLLFRGEMYYILLFVICFITQSNWDFICYYHLIVSISFNTVIYTHTQNVSFVFVSVIFILIFMLFQGFSFFSFSVLNDSQTTIILMYSLLNDKIQFS